MASGQALDKYVNFRFLVKIRGFASGGFQRVSAPSFSMDVITYQEGGYIVEAKQAGQAHFEDVTLERGMSADMDLYNWANDTLTGILTTSEYREDAISIIQRDRQGRDARAWVLERVWPTEYEGPEWDATANEVAIEKLTLACEGFRQEQLTAA